MESGIRIGKISSVDYTKGMMRVTYTDKGKATTTEMPYINYNNEYSMPEVGSQVLVAHLSNGSSRGVVLGTMWNKKNVPTENGKGLYRKDLSKTKGAALYRYNDEDGEYLLKAPNIVINAINQAKLEGPKVLIDANISIEVETEKFKIGAEKAEISIPEIKVDTDLKAEIKNLVLEVLEEISIETQKSLTVLAKSSIEAKTDAQMLLEDSVWKTSLSSIMSRLALLDGNLSDKK